MYLERFQYTVYKLAAKAKRLQYAQRQEPL